jgi:molecular chaperone HtpG
VSKKTNSETLGFQTEVRQLLQLMIHSLYSNKEIFLRELISNASDAADKLRFEALADPKLLGGDSELNIRVVVDKAKNTISVTDNGIGMSREDLIENLGTIAKSGTADFLQKMTGDDKKDAQLIGQFGVGFYSSFVVADKVIVETRRADLGSADAVRWESDGQGEFTVDAIERPERGTTVTLFLKDSEGEFSESLRLETLIRKYSDHIAFPVQLEDTGEDAKEPTTVNSATALWMRSRSEVEDEEYKEFYKYLSHDFSDPVAWSHNRVEGKREYTSLLYIPTQAPYDLWNRDAPRGLKLYVQRVFIMDDAEQFLPLYLRFVKGIVDASDMPLNVSRELLQNNPQSAAMKTALTRRVLDMLAKLAAGDSGEDRDTYKKFWKEFGQVLKEGLIEETQNADKLLKLLRFSTTHDDAGNQDQSLDEYLSRMKPDQDKIYYLLAENLATAKSSPHLEQLRHRGIEVMLLTDKIDPWLTDHLSEFDGKSFQDVGRGQLSLPEDDDAIGQETMNEENKPLLKKIRETLKDRIESVGVSQRLTESPACVVTAEQDLTPQLRRMLEASGQQIPETKPALEINIEHPLVKRLSSETDDERFGQLSNVLLDHALLAEGAQLDNPGAYVQRMNKLLLGNL